MIKAAGVILCTPQNQVLFVKKSDSGVWEYPGGHIEEGETAEQAAARELKEEIGSSPEGDRKLLARRISTALGDGDSPSEQVDYSTFIQSVKETFEPTLSSEHVGYAWAPIDQPPEPLHPGARSAIARLTMDELGVARAIIAGDLVSPQRYENMTLFAIRITGTGVSYRRGLDEFVWRDPAVYLNDEFLQRIGGLPVIFWHHTSKRAAMSSDDFVQRNVGSVFVPYIKGDEVWAIVRIYDDNAAAIISSEQWSTSPAVVFNDPSVNGKVVFDDGKKLLIEGKPSLIDHIALVERGVWDKGGPATGIETAGIGESPMTEEERMAEEKAKKDNEEKARKDAEEEKSRKDAAGMLDKMMSHLDSITKRLDAMEMSDKARKDAEEDRERKDKAKRDAEMSEDEKDKAKKDAAAKKDAEECAARDKAKKDAEEAEKDKARKDAEDIRKAMADMAARLPVQMSDADYAERATAQARADGVYIQFGKQAPAPMAGETPLAYRVRLLNGVKDHSKTYKDVALDKIAIADKAAFEAMEPQIYHDAEIVARSPATVPVGELRCIERKEGGHTIRDWVGEPAAWMNQFAGPVKHYGEGKWMTGSLH